jgi:hypothetical protein
MNYKELLTKIKKGELTSETGDRQPNPYIPATVTIEKCEIVDPMHSTIEHWTVNAAINNNSEAPIVAFHLLINIDGVKYQQIEGGFLFKKDTEKVNYYGTFTTKNGDTVPASLLHEITRRCAEFSDAQKAKFKFSPFVFNHEVYKDMQFLIDAKVQKNGKVRLLTADQEIEDKQYAENLQNTEKSETSEEVQVPQTDEELPF